MFRTLLARLTPLASYRSILLLLVVFMFFQIVATPLYNPLIEKTNGFGALDLNASYTPSQVYDALTAMAEDGRALYLRLELTVDLVFPIVSGLLFSLAAIYLFRRAFPESAWVQTLALAPLLVMLTDYLENGCVIALLLSFPKRLEGLVSVASTISTVKYALSVVELLLIVVGLAGWFGHWLRTRSVSPGAKGS